MRIGIIGAGEVGSTLARLWAAARHDLFLSARRPERLAPLVAELGARAQAGTVEEAARFGEDAVLLAVNYWTLDEALAAAGGALAGRVVIDATNPLAWKDGKVGGELVRLIPDGALAGKVMAARLPDSRVVKAFTTPNARAIASLARGPGHDPVAGPIAGDDAAAKTVVSRLVEDAGLVPVDLGPLASSADLDPGAADWGRPVAPGRYQASIGSQRPAASEAKDVSP
jgi:8-hydroxy-5-deazaflavin:NADPH oxidoreductase